MESAEHGAKLCELENVENKSLYLYSRWANPTTDAVAGIITRIEQAFGTHVCATGMAAITTVLYALLKSGDHVIVFTPVYGGTHEIFSEQFKKYCV